VLYRRMTLGTPFAALQVWGGEAVLISFAWGAGSIPLRRL